MMERADGDRELIEEARARLRADPPPTSFEAMVILARLEEAVGRPVDTAELFRDFE